MFKDLRNRLRRIAAAGGLGALLLAPPLAADDERIIDIIGGVEGAVPVAVVPFSAAGNVAPETDIASVIGANLARSGRFEVLPREEIIEEPARLEDVRFSTWRALGVDHMIVGGIRDAGDGAMEVRYELLDVFQGRRVDGRRFRADQRHLRILAHTIADTVYEELTGTEGVFRTRIAYVAEEDLGEEEGRRYRLIVADSDGHRSQVILSSREPLLSPAWSPDRERLAYVSFEGRRSEVFVQEAATGERERVASFRGINSAPAWSPDGERLAVTLSRDGAANIYIIHLDSGDVEPLTEHWAIDTEAAWSPDGEWVYFTSDRGGRPQIYRVPPEGGRPERVTYEGPYNAAPALSPDGEQLAMVHRREDAYHIAVMDLETEMVRTLSDGPNDESPDFAPNGDMILFAAGGSRPQLKTTSLHGRAIAPLHHDGGDGVRVREPAW